MTPKAPRPLQRVHRNLSKPEIEKLRESVAALVPASRAQIGELVKDMRLSTKRSQTEYAALCSVSLRVLRPTPEARPSTLASDLTGGRSGTGGAAAGAVVPAR